MGIFIFHHAHGPKRLATDLTSKNKCKKKQRLYFNIFQVRQFQTCYVLLEDGAQNSFTEGKVQNKYLDSEWATAIGNAAATIGTNK